MRTSPHLQLVKKSYASAQDAAAQYKQEMYTLINYAAQVKAYQMPVLSNPNEWPGGASAYQQTLATWANLVGQLQGWTMSTLQNLIALPNTLIQSGTQVISPTLSASLQFCQILIEQPDNQAAKSSLMTDLQLLSINFNQFSLMTTPLITSLHDQSTVFNQDAQIMTSIAAQALQTAGNDQALITQLNAQIAQLQADINAEAMTIAAGSVVTLAGLGIGALGIILAPFTGGASLTLLIPAVFITAGGAIVIALNAAKIVADKSAIDGLNSQINNTQSDIVLVNTMSSTLNTFAGQVDTLQNALNVVAAPWEASEKYFTDTYNTLNTIEHATSEDWQQVYDELNQINTDWNKLMVVMPQLEVDSGVTNAQLSVGMTSQQVGQAMQAATSQNIIQYLMAA